jgi:hypothetical protein
MATKKTDSSDRRKLTDWIQNYYLSHGWEKSEINWAMILSQLKNMQTKDKNIKDTGVIYTLWYMTVVKEIEMLDDCENGSILNLVPFYYYQAQDYYLKDQKVMKSFRDFDFETNTVVAQRVPLKQNRKKTNITFD